MRLAPYLAAARTVIRSNFRRLPRPYKLTLALTFRCNLRCYSCRTWSRPAGAEVAAGDWETFFRKQNYFIWVDLTGGEITLRPDLPEIIAAVGRHCPNLLLLHFPTNGYWPDRVLAAVRAAQPRPETRLVVTVSLDGPPEVHDRLRGVSGSWERAVETLATLRREPGVEAFVGTTLQPANLNLSRQTLAAVRQRIPQIRPSDFHFNLAQNSFIYDNLEVELSPAKDLTPAVSQVWRDFRPPLGVRRYLERAYQRAARHYLADGRCPFPCLALSASCYIAPAGVVYPCTGYPHQLGALTETGFELGPIWDHPAAIQTQQEIYSGDCPQCWTPCEAYQTLLGNLCRRPRARR